MRRFLLILALVGYVRAGGYGAPEAPAPPPPEPPYDAPAPATEPAPAAPEEPPMEEPPVEEPPVEEPPAEEPPAEEPPAEEPPAEEPPAEEPPAEEPPAEEPPMAEPPADEGYSADPPPPPPTEPPPPPPTEPPPPPPTEPPPPPPVDEPGYSDVEPLDTMIEDVELTETGSYGAEDPITGRRVVKKFRRRFALKKPDIKDLWLQFVPKCFDTKPFCPQWARQGECAKNPRRMLSKTRGCARSCGVCTPNKQEWRLRRHNAGVLRRRLLKKAKGRKLIFKRRRTNV